jgi:acyl-CoA synthetase (AMP-forming)/AMP-acid ligase II
MTSSTYDPINKIWRGPTRPSIFNTEAGLGFIILNLLKQNPDRVMQVCDDSGAEMTCGEMRSRTLKISNFLSSKTELKQGDVVGIIARNSENIAAVAFACFSLGLPINPLAPAMGVSEIFDMYSKTKPKAIFCDFDQVEKVCEALKQIGLKNCKIFTLMEKVEGFEFVDEILKSFDGNVEEFE